MTDFTAVGTSIPRIDALEKVTGKARYCSDFKMPGMLYAKMVASPYAHAKILRIDASAAEKLPGVRAIALPQDAPKFRSGGYLQDAFVLPVDNIVRCINQPVAIVMADTPEIAEAAVDLVEVDYEEMPAVFDPEQALLSTPPTLVHPEMKDGLVCMVGSFRYDPSIPNCFRHYKIRHGDINKGFADADLILENKYTVDRMAHCCLETHQADAWIENDGTYAIRMSTQTPQAVLYDIAAAFGVPVSRVRVITPYVGGGFGGKARDEGLIAPLAVLAAIKSGRPVRLANSRSEEFISGGQRADVVIYIKDGVKKDGTLVAREIKTIFNAGRHAGQGYLITQNMLYGAVGTYRIPNFKADSYGVYTDNPPAIAFRGFGSPEVTWAVEQQMDMMAEKLGIDPMEFRRQNILRDGDKDANGQTTVAIGARGCLDKVTEWIGWGEKPKSEGVWRRGKGVTLGNKYTFSIPACATVKVHSDGKIEVRHGNSEIGQGLNTTMAQIAAEEFGIPVDRVKIVYGDTAICPFDHGSISSRSTFFTGNAVKLACQDAKRRVCELASIKLGVSADQLYCKEGKVFVTGKPETSLGLNALFTYRGVPLKGGEIIGSDSYRLPMVPEDPETGQSDRAVTYYSHFAQAVDVAVNVETGEVRVLRIATAADMGQPINPKMCQAQMEGGFQQGIGTALYERVALENGVVNNPNFAEYKMPTARDMPLNKDTAALMNPVPHPEGPFGAKGVGEGVLVAVAPAISNAIYNAVGIRIKHLPIFREDVLKALKEKSGQ